MSYLKRHDIPPIPIKNNVSIWLDSARYVHCGHTGYKYATSKNSVYLKDEDIHGEHYLKSNISLKTIEKVLVTNGDIYIVDETALMNFFENNVFSSIPYCNNEGTNRYTISTSALKNGDVSWEIVSGEESE